MSRNVLWVIPVLLIAAFVVVAPSFRGGFTVPENFPVLDPAEIDPAPPAGGMEMATFGSGCFWCTEAVFQQLKGVSKVVSGYSGGHVPNPSYQQVCTGTTGHAEVIQVTFDPAVVSYPTLLEVFWRLHDPTTPDQQGFDCGPQYRSVAFTHTDRQQRLAERYREKITAAGVFPNPVVTEVVPFTAFYPAGADHQNYYATHSGQAYCRNVIGPKLAKLKAAFKDKMTTE